MRALLNTVQGWCEIRTESEHATDALNQLKAAGFAHWRMRTDTEGTLRFRMLMKDTEQFLRLCPTASAGRLHGLPSLLKKYRGRWGIPIGAVLFSLLIWLSCSVVWAIDVTGNERLSEREIISMLEEYGFGIGSRFREVDFDILQNDFLLTTDEIAWIAVNMEGTVAHVQVRENLGGRSRGESTAGAANVIASEDGQIVEVRVIGGRAAVQRGDVVRAGDLLISGVLAVREDGMRFEYGKGEVFAQVLREICVESPLICEEYTPTGRETVRKTVNFFAKDVKLFRNSSIEYATYDTIIMEKQLSLPGGLDLPIWITTETVRETAPTTVTRTEAEAFADAAILLKKEMDSLLAEAEILSMETERVCEDGVCRITVRAVCLADIAQTREIDLQ